MHASSLVGGRSVCRPAPGVDVSRKKPTEIKYGRSFYFKLYIHL